MKLGKKLLFINFILAGVFFASSVLAESCPSASPVGVGCASGQYYCGGQCRTMSSCPTWSPSPTCAAGLNCANCSQADSCGVCSQCNSNYTLCGTYPNKACKANTTPPDNCQTYNQCTEICSACNNGYYLVGNQCVQTVLKLGSDSASGATAVVQSTNNTLMYIGSGGISIGTSTIPEATTLNVFGSSSFFHPLVVGAPTAGNHAATKDYVDSVVTGGGSPGTSYWIASSTNIYNSNTGNVGIGDSEPYSKLSVSGSIAGSGSLAITGTAANSNYFISNLGIGGLPSGFWNKFVDLSGSGNSAYIAKTGSINAVVAASDSGTPANTGYNFTYSGQQMVLGTVTNQPLNFITNGTSKMFLSADGNLGIGTTAPLLPLQVNGKVVIGDSVSTTRLNSLYGPRAINLIDSNASIRVWRFSANTASAAQLELGIGANNDFGNTANKVWMLGAWGNGQFTINDRTGGGNGVERFRIDNVGNVGIGTTSPSQKLTVNGNIYNTGFITSDSTIMSYNPNSGHYIYMSVSDDGYTNLYSESGLIAGHEPNSGYYIYGDSVIFVDPFYSTVGIGTYPSTTIGLSIASPGTVAIDTANGRIANLGAPVYSSDAATKDYVDTAVAGGSSGTSYWTASNNNIYNSNTGNVGIGITTPEAKLNIYAGNSHGLKINGFGSGNFNGIDLSNSGLSGNADHWIYIDNNNHWRADNFLRASYIYASGYLSTPSYAAANIFRNYTQNNPLKLISQGNGDIQFFTATTTQSMTLDYYGNLGINTTTPSYKLDVNGNARFTGTVKVATPHDPDDAVTKSYLDSALINSTSSNAYVLKAGDSMSGNLDMSGHNIVGVNKLTVTTIDPLYDIGGVKYSTYASTIVGSVKEEYVGKGEINHCVDNYCFWRLNFAQQQPGSDLWVWRQIVDFQPDKIDVLMTAYGQPASLSYEIDGNQIIFYADRPTKFSYRLVGARFDWRKWPTLANDQSEKAGLIIR
ncbi:MAG TPA: hypothetical protein PLP46_01035 [bacterium]|nr:hypothetical protein [bacterium]HOQ91703.1 hypothetical protein [bacterium]